MWMGYFPVLPSKMLEAGELYKVIDERREELLGKAHAKKLGRDVALFAIVLARSMRKRHHD